MPELRNERRLRPSVVQILLFGAGCSLMFVWAIDRRPFFADDSPAAVMGRVPRAVSNLQIRMMMLEPPMD